MGERIMLFTLGFMMVSTVYSSDIETENVDMGLIEFLGEGKMIDGEWVDPITIEDQKVADGEEQNHE